jgi:hypothetical protein
LNSRISRQAAVINAMEEFNNDFRRITMDQRNASGGESTGPIPVDDPWNAFADEQLGLMNNVGIRQFFFFGNCIGRSFADGAAPGTCRRRVLSPPIGQSPSASSGGGNNFATASTPVNFLIGLWTARIKSRSGPYQVALRTEPNWIESTATFALRCAGGAP